MFCLVLWFEYQFYIKLRIWVWLKKKYKFYQQHLGLNQFAKPFFWDLNLENQKSLQSIYTLHIGFNNLYIHKPSIIWAIIQRFLFQIDLKWIQNLIATFKETPDKQTSKYIFHSFPFFMLFLSSWVLLQQRSVL